MKLGRVVLDGSKVKANASKHKAMSYGPPRPTSRSTLYRPSMSSFSTVEVYSINDANFWYVETGDVPSGYRKLRPI
jgi:hypothetical protein